MGKKNQAFHRGPQKANYSTQQKIVVDAYRKAERDTTQQFVMDMVMLALMDPKVVGKGHTFGKVRMKRLMDAVNANIIKWDNLLVPGDEQDYYQIKLDHLLEPVCTDFKPFAVRYPWLKPPK